MNYLTTPWVKLYRSPDADWVRLPMSARGLGSESLKYARQEDGFLIDTEGEPLGVALAFFMGARPTEHERIQADAEKLVAHGFFELRGTRVFVRNFVDAQTRQSPAAIRKARQRAKDKAEQDAVRDAGRDLSRDTSRGVSHALSRGIETNRNESKRHEPNRADPAAAPEPGSSERSGFDFVKVYETYPHRRDKYGVLSALQKLVTNEDDYRRLLESARKCAARFRGSETSAPKIRVWLKTQPWRTDPAAVAA